MSEAFTSRGLFDAILGGAAFGFLFMFGGMMELLLDGTVVVFTIFSSAVDIQRNDLAASPVLFTMSTFETAILNKN